MSTQRSDAASYVDDRNSRKDKILSGDRVPTIEDMREGLPPLRDDVLMSARALIKTAPLQLKKHEEILPFLDAVDLAPSVTTLLALRAELGPFSEFRYRISWHSALLGDDDSAAEVCEEDTSRFHDMRALFQSAFIAGLRFQSAHGFLREEWRAGTMDDIVEGALETFRRQRDALAVYDEALQADDKKKIEKQKRLEEIFDEHEDILRLVDEDRAESRRAVGDFGRPKTHEVRVVPPLETAGGKDRKSIRDQFKATAGKALPLVTRGGVGSHFAALAGRWPHLDDEIEQILLDLSVQDPIWIRPTILVGGAGTGKSSLARGIGKQLGLHTTVFNAAGVSDGMFGGISANWSSAGCSIPLQCVNTSKTANPLLVIDEIEKAGTGRHNGNLVDTLLAFLDRGNAAKYRDPALETEVDLSWVSYILTANSLDGIPMPLRDRCRIVPIPDPDFHHVGDLVKHIVEDIAQERGLDKRWYPPLAEDEMNVVTKAWGGGSLRKLRRAVEVLLQGRDQQMMARA